MIKEQKLVIFEKMIDKLLIIKEIAKVLQASNQSVNQYIVSRQLQASCIDQWRIKESDLEKFLKKHSNDKRKKIKR